VGARLAELVVADPPERWAKLGFAVADAHVDLDGVRLRLGGDGEGVVAWSLRGGPPSAAIDGLADAGPPPAQPPPTVTHPNGAVALDHVVVVTPDFDRTAAALNVAGMPLRRVRDAGSFRQGFRRLGPAILELVEAADAPAGPARFWGLVVIVSDLEALRTRLGELVGATKPAVQPGRHIVTLRRAAGVSTRVAFMDPES
jgi:hypothetical protein